MIYRVMLVVVLMVVSFSSSGFSTEPCASTFLTVTSFDEKPIIVRLDDILMVKPEQIHHPIANPSGSTFKTTLSVIYLRTQEQHTTGGKNDFFGRSNEKVVQRPVKVYVMEGTSEILERLSLPICDGVNR